MDNYEKFGNENESVSPPEISVRSETTDGGKKADDVEIKVDSAAGDGRLQIYKTEVQENMDYVDDPGAKDIPRGGIEGLQWMVKSVLEHIAFRLVTVVLILLDFIFVIVELTDQECKKNQGTLEILSHVLISYFMLEVFFRVFYQGKRLLTECMVLEMIDIGVVTVSFVVDVAFLLFAEGNSCGDNYAKLLIIGRVVRILRIARIIFLMVQQKRHIATASRRIVSQNKRRYQRDGFDLDLCYITERVIAMSFPSKGMMAMYRNNVNEVARFFNTKHKGHYRIYNLCSERDYDETLFNNCVERVYIDDHNVPRVREMVAFCTNVEEWMEQDKQNVIAIHCKGGKGRTGTMICTWLVHCGVFDEAQESLDYFGDRRTDLTVGKTFQGVETPSQSRYVGYFERVKKDLNGCQPPETKKRITSVKIEGLEGVGNGDGSDLSMEIRVDGLLIYECRFGDNMNCQVTKYMDTHSVVANLQSSPVIIDDVKIRFLSTAKNIPQIYDHCAFFFWFHTYFIEDNKLYLSRDEIDNPHKKKAKAVFKDNFAVELQFEDVKEWP
ncbi:phosphatidylinositol 3,4,5-trisphosphate 3-phosphatase TPTE2-like [Ostrea edulis]|uniref:phosphatidylinositol 3,4,5-trisphosphate 3-phosphatase TPTE2-like n=1 Tax=Ostrea edulis TaxID=37623 RepID=UPI00209480E6|nr:phosphatidylinositol 3,4,5-trisphosphate 3-phosphatase TPTE2-like [Ostrea edulis]XP_048776039.1 phosphatidylinositol 3,4,5-trisphosphate 3-phosphatase TPTE2-like [Ostrea edulis]